MMKFFSTLCIGLILGQTAQAQELRTYRIGRSTKSNVDFYNSNYGMFGLDVLTSRAGFIYPRGSGMAYIAGSGLWFGCKKSVNGVPKPATFITYNPNSGGSWTVPGEHGIPPQVEPFYTSTTFSHSTGGYTGGDSAGFGTKWPLWLTQQQQLLTPMYEAIYEPDNALRTPSGGIYTEPAFMPYVDEQQVARFNDGDLTRYEKRSSLDTNVYPLGLQFQQTTYAWKSGVLQATVLLHYQIRNVSDDTLHECFAAAITEPDLGVHENDNGRFYSQRPDLRSMYIRTDAEARGNYGALVATLVEAPVTNHVGFILDDQRLRYYHDGRVGACQIWPIEEDPQNDVQRYEFMASKEIDSANAPTNDYRAAIASRTFTLRPGDVAHFTIAYSVIPSVPDMNGPIAELEHVVEPLMQYYYSPNGFQGASGVHEDNTASEAATLAAVPNPARESAQIHFTGGGSGMRIRIVDVLGREIESRDLGTVYTGSGSVRVDCRSYAAGLYFVRLENARGMAAVTPLVINR